MRRLLPLARLLQLFPLQMGPMPALRWRFLLTRLFLTEFWGLILVSAGMFQLLIGNSHVTVFAYQSGLTNVLKTFET